MKQGDLYALGGVPIDRTALRSILPGIDYVPGLKPGPLMFDVQPPMRTMRRSGSEAPPEDMTGRRWGRLTVVGYWGRKKNARGTESQKWVCRCTCGRFVIRTGKTIKAPRDADDKCEACRHLAFLQHEDLRRRVGDKLADAARLRRAAVTATERESA